MPLPALPALASITGFLKSKKFLAGLGAVLFLCAVGGGTYLYLKHQTKEAVAAAVDNVNSEATIKSYQTKDAISTRNVEVDRKFDELRDRTTQDYANARSNLNAAPAEARDAQAPRIIVDTLNDLDRMRSSRDSGGVPDADVPAG